MGVRAASWSLASAFTNKLEAVGGVVKVGWWPHLLLRGEAVGCGGGLVKNLELEMAQSVRIFDLVASVLHIHMHLDPRVTHR